MGYPRFCNALPFSNRNSFIVFEPFPQTSKYWQSIQAQAKHSLILVSTKNRRLTESHFMHFPVAEPKNSNRSLDLRYSDVLRECLSFLRVFKLYITFPILDIFRSHETDSPPDPTLGGQTKQPQKHQHRAA